MPATIKKLFGLSVSLVCFAAVSFYFGGRVARESARGPQAENPFSGQFAAEPGDGWMLFGGFLALVAAALTAAGLMLWNQERRGRG